jgi:hypothetical protein
MTLYASFSGCNLTRGKYPLAQIQAILACRKNQRAILEASYERI